MPTEVVLAIIDATIATDIILTDKVASFCQSSVLLTPSATP